MPRFTAFRSTTAPCADATVAVWSSEPSSTTQTSAPGSASRIAGSNDGRLRDSLYAGTMTSVRTASSLWGADASTDILFDSGRKTADHEVGPGGARQNGSGPFRDAQKAGNPAAPSQPGHAQPVMKEEARDGERLFACGLDAV